MGILQQAAEFSELARAVWNLIPNRLGDAARVAEARERRLRELLRHAAASSPFYRERFRGVDVETCALSDLPSVTKQEMMANIDAVFTDRNLRRDDLEELMSDSANLGKLHLGKYAVCHTSGSQGQPAIVVQDKHALLTTFGVQFARGTKVKRRFMPHIRRVLNPAALAVITQKPGFYPSSTFFNYFPRTARPFLKLNRLSVFQPPEELVAELNALQPSFITGYTTALAVLAREEQAGRLKLRQGGRLEQMTSMSEPLPDATARWIESVFGVHVASQYAMAECMALSSPCNVCNGCHLNSDLAILEVVDADNRPVPDGTPGSKVLLTNLYNFTQPIIRYEIDDIVTMSSKPCDCGSVLPLIQSVEGRAADLLWVSVDGRTRDLPYFLFMGALDKEPDIAEHQVLQTGVNTFHMKAAPQEGRSISAGQLEKLLYDVLANEGLAGVVTLDVEIVDRILPDKSGKVTRSRNLIGPPPEPESAAPSAAVVA